LFERKLGWKLEMYVEPWRKTKGEGKIWKSESRKTLTKDFKQQEEHRRNSRVVRKRDEEIEKPGQTCFFLFVCLFACWDEPPRATRPGRP